MADALCGPANALQSFQKHTQVDRTLQQDRLTGARYSPGQGFRSFDPRAGSLDADFHAFENAQAAPFRMENPILGIQPQHGPSMSQPRTAPVTVDWAADFQNMRISDHPIPVQQFRAEAPLIRSNPGGWQSEFARQNYNHNGTISQGKQPEYFQQAVSQQIGLQHGFQQHIPLHDQTAQFNNQSHMSNLAQMQQLDQQSSAQDWSQAFEEALESAHEVEETVSRQRDEILHQDGIYTNDRSQIIESPAIQEHENIRIGADAIEYTEVQDRSADQDARDANALARIAGELLHNVQHESDTKFQNSQFLDLMRKIRDKQVEVRNDDFEAVQVKSSMLKDDRQEPIPDASQSKDGFTFPDMNTVFQPDPAEVDYYSFDSDQFPFNATPMSQMQALHPGGKLYPATPEAQHASMSGGLGAISADDFDTYDENRDMANRYHRSAEESRTSET